jgi:acetyl-CoA carboxylase biotin carboxyl carrier protein
MKINTDQLDELLKLFESSDFDELLIETQDVRLQARRNGAAASAPVTVAAAEVEASPSADAATPAPHAPPTSSGDSAAAKQSVEGVTAVCAAVSGIFYSSPSPTEDPFVEVGSRVEAEDAVGLIEVMKLFTSVSAGAAGEVVDIIAKNASSVQAGDTLLHIRPDA